MLQTARFMQFSNFRTFATGKKYNLYQTINGIETRITNHQPSKLQKQGPRQVSKTILQLQKMVLPIGYPWSVHENYFKTHAFQFCESTAGSVISVLCAQAMLSSVGVSSSLVATGSASVAINWVLKDGIGEIGKLILIQQSSHLFDSYPKTCKLIGEYISVLGSWFQISTLFFPHLFLPLASCAITLRGIHYSIWTSTHTTFNALSGDNMGDLMAKDDAQLSLAHLLGLSIGISALGLSTNPIYIVSGVLILSAIQIWSTLQFIKNARFPVLNVDRLLLLSKQFIENGKFVELDSSKAEKSLVFGEFIMARTKKSLNLPQVVFAKSLLDIGKHLDLDAIEFKDQKYLVCQTKSKKYKLLLEDDSTATDIIQAILHISYSHHHGKSLEECQDWTAQNLDNFISLLNNGKWSCDRVYWPDRGQRFNFRPVV